MLKIMIGLVIGIAIGVAHTTSDLGSVQLSTAGLSSKDTTVTMGPGDWCIVDGIDGPCTAERYLSMRNAQGSPSMAPLQGRTLLSTQNYMIALAHGRGPGLSITEIRVNENGEVFCAR